MAKMVLPIYVDESTQFNIDLQVRNAFNWTDSSTRSNTVIDVSKGLYKLKEKPSTERVFFFISLVRLASLRLFTHLI
jgi:hypothetical protein